MQAALYIHIPWCIKKCPYCDFNSHKSPLLIPEDLYVEALIDDLRQDLTYLPQREISSIFIGGGTPSLLSASAYLRLFENLQGLLPWQDKLEITLEANPGTVDEGRFKTYREIGINRLSLGVQSFNPLHLKRLGRIHDATAAHSAIAAAKKAGFDNINIDLMYGLPNQTVQEGLSDLEIALGYAPTHLSWYQLTLEPNTVFYKEQPTLPDEATTDSLETQGLQMLAQHGLERYEISAFCRNGQYARHNLNYWLFGDYYGIGAGAHGKLTDASKGVLRTKKQRQPTDYLNPSKAYLVALESPDTNSVLFEFMLNTTRLQQAIPHSLFTERTGLTYYLLEKKLLQAQEKGLIKIDSNCWQVTPMGRRFTNDLQSMFLP